jgi:hypothetical protein
METTRSTKFEEEIAPALHIGVTDVTDSILCVAHNAISSLAGSDAW